MSQLTERNREWLDHRFARDGEGGYVAHQPTWGYLKGKTEPQHLMRFARSLNLFRWIAALEFEDFCDIGGGDGYTGALIRGLFGKRVVTSDLSLEAAHRASEFFGLRSCAANSARLPFRSDAFDMVLCGEVLEHLEFPFASLSELIRVTRKYLVITTLVSFPNRLLRTLALKTRRTNEPHFDRNIWMAEDFPAIFGPHCAVKPEFSLGNLDDVQEPEAARTRLMELANVTEVGRRSVGVIVVVAKNGHKIPEPTRDYDLRISDLLFAGPASLPLVRDTWEPVDIGKLTVAGAQPGAATLDLLLDVKDEAENPFLDNPRVRLLTGKFLESNTVSGILYLFYAFLLQVLRPGGIRGFPGALMRFARRAIGK